MKTELTDADRARIQAEIDAPSTGGIRDDTPWLIEEAKAFLAERREAAKHIDPETCEVDWTYAQTLDPYGIDHMHPEEYRLTEEYQQVGRAYFARSPGSDVWVCFYDLPAATADALFKKHKAKLMFPAGLPVDDSIEF